VGPETADGRIRHDLERHRLAPAVPFAVCCVGADSLASTSAGSPLYDPLGKWECVGEEDEEDEDIEHGDWILGGKENDHSHEGARTAPAGPTALGARKADPPEAS